MVYGLWCLTLLSTIFQLYRDGNIGSNMKMSAGNEEITCISQVELICKIGKSYMYHKPWPFNKGRYQILYPSKMDFGTS